MGGRFRAEPPFPHHPAMTPTAPLPPLPMSRHQKAVIAMLAFLQFAVILDFMLMSPLGAGILSALSIGPR